MFTIQSVSGFDGIVDINADAGVSRASLQIAESESIDLERDVFWEHKVVVCASCKETLVSLFMSELMSRHDTDQITTNRNLH